MQFTTIFYAILFVMFAQITTQTIVNQNNNLHNTATQNTNNYNPDMNFNIMDTNPANSVNNQNTNTHF